MVPINLSAPVVRLLHILGFIYNICITYRSLHHVVQMVQKDGQAHLLRCLPSHSMPHINSMRQYALYRVFTRLLCLAYDFIIFLKSVAIFNFW